MKKNKKQKTNYKRNRLLKAYSLIEVLVAMGILAIIIVIFFNSLIIAFQVSFKTSSRSFIREEISAVSLSILRDVRNADIINTCGNTGATEECNFVVDGRFVRWYKCLESICREEVNNGEVLQTYKTANQLKIDQVSFEPGFSGGNDPTERNILLTIVAAHSNEDLEINNVIRQTSISTRNYEL